MKVRSDYVSNSSSSSFIIMDDDTLGFFNITKQDIMDALAELHGGKDAIERYVNAGRVSALKNPEWHKDDIKYDEWGPFYVYDLYDKKDRKRALERWGDLLKDWKATNCHLDIHDLDEKGKPTVKHGAGQIDNFNKIVQATSQIYDISDYEIESRVETDYWNIRKFVPSKTKDPATGMYGHYEPINRSVGKFLNATYRECGVMTNLDVLKSKIARFFIHADDNELVRGPICEDGVADDVEDSASCGEDRKWKTQSYSYDRVCEYLLDYFIRTGKIRPTDPKYLEFMKVDDKYLTKWDKEHGEIYDFANGLSLTWQDLKRATMTWCMHEG